MHAVPRIVRAVPSGPVTRPEHGIPVLASIHWHGGEDMELPAIATAWTREAVEVAWEAPALGMRVDWIPAEDVRRSAGAPPAAGPRTPRVRPQAGRPRW